MLFKEVTIGNSVNHTEHADTLCGQNSEFFNVKVSDIYSNNSEFFNVKASDIYSNNCA
jgi:DNA-binding XRE family transcriptional regulator